MDVYPAGEAPVPGVSGKTFLDVVLEHEGHPSTAPTCRAAWTWCPIWHDMLREGDLVITMGAGDVTAIGPQLLDALRAPRVPREGRREAAMAAQPRVRPGAPCCVDDALRRRGLSQRAHGAPHHLPHRRPRALPACAWTPSARCAMWSNAPCELLGARGSSSGAGSNLLVADEGCRRRRDHARPRFPHAAASTRSTRASSWARASPLSSVVQEAFKRSLAGLEFAVGTPGTIGGALRMNAGSRDEWLGSRVVAVTTYSPGSRHAPHPRHPTWRGATAPARFRPTRCWSSARSRWSRQIRSSSAARWRHPSRAARRPSRSTSPRAAACSKTPRATPPAA